MERLRRIDAGVYETRDGCYRIMRHESEWRQWLIFDLHSEGSEPLWGDRERNVWGSLSEAREVLADLRAPGRGERRG